MPFGACSMGKPCSAKGAGKVFGFGDSSAAHTQAMVLWVVVTCVLRCYPQTDPRWRGDCAAGLAHGACTAGVSAADSNFGVGGSGREGIAREIIGEGIAGGNGQLLPARFPPVAHPNGTPEWHCDISKIWRRPKRRSRGARFLHEG